MEEKKTIRISMSTFFLIIAIIAICVMGFFIYKLNDEKTTATEQVKSLNSKISNLEDTVTNFQNSSSKTTTQETTNLTTNNSSTNSKYELNGTYEWNNPDGEGITCTFSNGTFTMQSGWNYKGTYVISGNKVKLKTTEMLDQNSNSSKYVPTTEQNEEEWTIEDNKLIRNIKQDDGSVTSQTLVKKSISNASDITGTYEWTNPDGEGIICTFSNGTFTMQSSWNYKGTYVISGNKVKLKTTEMLDQNSNGSKYVPTTEQNEEEWTIEDNRLIRNIKQDDGSVTTQILIKK